MSEPSIHMLAWTLMGFGLLAFGKIAMGVTAYVVAFVSFIAFKVFA